MRNKRIFLPVIAIAISSLVASCAPGASGGAGSAPTPAASKPGAQVSAKPTGGTAGDPTKGQQAYMQSCASCHGPDAKGLPNLGKDLVGGAFAKGQGDAELIAFIKKGRPVSDPANTTKIDMPPKGGNPALTDAQIADIVAYLRTLQK